MGYYKCNINSCYYCMGVVNYINNQPTTTRELAFWQILDAGLLILLFFSLLLDRIGHKIRQGMLDLLNEMMDTIMKDLKFKVEMLEDLGVVEKKPKKKKAKN